MTEESVPWQLPALLIAAFPAAAKPCVFPLLPPDTDPCMAAAAAASLGRRLSGLSTGEGEVTLDCLESGEEQGGWVG